jgi:hypothetical protein
MLLFRSSSGQQSHGVGGIFSPHVKTVYPLFNKENTEPAPPKLVLTYGQSCHTETHGKCSISKELPVKKTSKRKTEQDSNCKSTVGKKMQTEKTVVKEGNEENEANALVPVNKKLKRNIVSILDEVFDDSE